MSFRLTVYSAYHTSGYSVDFRDKSNEMFSDTRTGCIDLYAAWLRKNDDLVDVAFFIEPHVGM